MLPVSLVSFFCIVIYLFFGFDIILKNRRSVMNRVFLLLHFHLLLCGKGNKSIPYIIAGYIPSLYFIIHVFGSGYYITDFQKGSLGWYPATMTAPRIAVYNALVFLLYAIIELFLAFRYGYTSRSKRIKRQSVILIVSNLLAFVAGGLFQSTVIAKNLPLPLLPFTTMLIWIGGIWYALYRYNFLGFTLSLASPQIVSRFRPRAGPGPRPAARRNRSPRPLRRNDDNP